MITWSALFHRRTRKQTYDRHKNERQNSQKPTQLWFPVRQYGSIRGYWLLTRDIHQGYVDEFVRMHILSVQSKTRMIVAIDSRTTKTSPRSVQGMMIASCTTRACDKSRRRAETSKRAASPCVNIDQTHSGITHRSGIHAIGVHESHFRSCRKPCWLWDVRCSGLQRWGGAVTATCRRRGRRKRMCRRIRTSVFEPSRYSVFTAITSGRRMRMKLSLITERKCVKYRRGMKRSGYSDRKPATFLLGILIEMSMWHELKDKIEGIYCSCQVRNQNRI